MATGLKKTIKVTNAKEIIDTKKKEVKTTYQYKLENKEKNFKVKIDSDDELPLNIDDELELKTITKQTKMT